MAEVVFHFYFQQCGVAVPVSDTCTVAVLGASKLSKKHLEPGYKYVSTSEKQLSCDRRYLLYDVMYMTFLALRMRINTG